uniref:Paired domain-containing protein n=1 Tax=Acrobeloides nanus TaxID=290746 RepID=A0A914DA84_9BILA
MKELRPVIIRAHEKGKGVREIVRFLDIEPSTVSRTIKRFEETGSNENRKGKKQQEAEEIFSTLKRFFVVE